MTMINHLNLVVDTNVYISAVGFDNLLLDFLNFCYDSNFIQIYISTEIYKEIEEVIFRKNFDRKVKNSLSSNDKKDFLQNLKLVSIWRDPREKIAICRDLKDNKFLELAKTIQADYLITGDKDLLELKEFEETLIIKPSEFLKKVSEFPIENI